MDDRTSIWEWDVAGRSRRSLSEPAHPSSDLRPDTFTVAKTHPTFHQHVYGAYGVRHEHVGAHQYHEHEVRILKAEVRMGFASVHRL